jgi:hypothetical protein
MNFNYVSIFIKPEYRGKFLLLLNIQYINENVDFNLVISEQPTAEKTFRI